MAPFGMTMMLLFCTAFRPESTGSDLMESRILALSTNSSSGFQLRSCSGSIFVLSDGPFDSPLAPAPALTPPARVMSSCPMAEPLLAWRESPAPESCTTVGRSVSGMLAVLASISDLIAMYSSEYFLALSSCTPPMTSPR